MPSKIIIHSLNQDIFFSSWLIYNFFLMPGSSFGKHDVFTGMWVFL